MKAKWIAALRSGKYQQSWGALRGYDGYCCLGVLCDVADPEGWDGDSHRKYVSQPEQSILDSVGLTNCQVTRLIHLNDREDASFADIADYLEKL